MKQTAYDAVSLFCFAAREEMGRVAAADAAAALAAVLSAKEEANIVFAAAPSQNELLRHFREAGGIDWRRVNAFHMDEYIGLPAEDPRRFSAFLDGAVFNHLPFGSVHRLNSAADPEDECARYAALLREHVPDIVLMGIGENGHIAFNDPPADFADPRLVGIVELDRACRQQQVNDGCFPDFDSVPSTAMTLTVPALVAPGEIICVVPGGRKAAAVRDALLGGVTPACPASALRTAKGRVRMYIDADAGQLL